MKYLRAHYMAHPNVGDTHQILNVSMIVMLAKIYKEVVVYAPADCCDDLRAQINVLDKQLAGHITYITNKILSHKQFPFWLSCGLQTLVSLMKTRKGEDVFFSTLNWLCFPVFNIWCKLSKRHMYTLCHNDLEHLIDPKLGKINVRWHLINYIFKSMSLAKYNMLIVLGDSIADNLNGIINAKTYQYHILSMCHPYYSLTSSTNSGFHIHGITNIGIVGAVKPKDFNSIMNINRILSHYPQVKLYNISTTSVDISRLGNIINLNQQNKHFGREDYDRIIEKMDMLFYPYPANSYRLSASGAVFEAIVKRKPILAMENPYFKWLFEKFGTLGYLFTDYAELESCFKDIETNGLNTEVLDNLSKAKKIVNPLCMFHELKSILN